MGSGQEPPKSAPLPPCCPQPSNSFSSLLHWAWFASLRYRRCQESSGSVKTTPQLCRAIQRVMLENGLDPATLPDADTGFSDTILGITFHGSAHLFNGHFWRLSTIHRTGETSFTVEGTKVRLTANVGVQQILDDCVPSFPPAALI